MATFSNNAFKFFFKFTQTATDDRKEQMNQILCHSAGINNTIPYCKEDVTFRAKNFHNPKLQTV